MSFLCSLQSVSTDMDSLFAFMLSVLYIWIQQQHFIPFLKEQYSTKLRKEKNTIRLITMLITMTDRRFWLPSCLPLIWANRSVHDLGKWYPKFRTGKFRLGIAFTVYFVQISTIYRKTTTKAWNWYQRRLWRNGTQISVIWNISSGKTGVLSIQPKL